MKYNPLFDKLQHNSYLSGGQCSRRLQSEVQQGGVKEIVSKIKHIEITTTTYIPTYLPFIGGIYYWKHRFWIPTTPPESTNNKSKNNNNNNRYMPNPSKGRNGSYAKVSWHSKGDWTTLYYVMALLLSTSISFPLWPFIYVMKRNPTI